MVKYKIDDILFDVKQRLFVRMRMDNWNPDSDWEPVQPLDNQYILSLSRRIDLRKPPLAQVIYER